MAALSPLQAKIAPNVLLDARLALFHETERWLAIADLHFGFELSQRAAGRLVPFWGMDSTSARLLQLIADYQPQRLIIIGDLVHDAAAFEPLRDLLARVATSCEVIAIAGNHDRGLRRKMEMIETFATRDFEFHHGHCAPGTTNLTKIIGHFHPAAMLRDGAGLHLKFPAFVQKHRCWILPAFSPWSAGTVWEAQESAQIWLCTPRRILALASRETAA